MTDFDKAEEHHIHGSYLMTELKPDTPPRGLSNWRHLLERVLLHIGESAQGVSSTSRSNSVLLNLLETYYSQQGSQRVMRTCNENVDVSEPLECGVEFGTVASWWGLHGGFLTCTVARVYLDLMIQKSYAGCTGVSDDDVCSTTYFSESKENCESAVSGGCCKWTAGILYAGTCDLKVSPGPSYLVIVALAVTASELVGGITGVAVAMLHLRSVASACLSAPRVVISAFSRGVAACLHAGPWLWRLGIPVGIGMAMNGRMACTELFELKEGNDGHEAWRKLAASASLSVVEQALIIVSAAAIQAVLKAEASAEDIEGNAMDWRVQRTIHYCSQLRRIQREREANGVGGLPAGSFNLQKHLLYKAAADKKAAEIAKEAEAVHAVAAALRAAEQASRKEKKMKMKNSGAILRDDPQGGGFDLEEYTRYKAAADKEAAEHTKEVEAANKKAADREAMSTRSELAQTKGGQKLQRKARGLIVIHKDDKIKDEDLPEKMEEQDTASDNAPVQLIMTLGLKRAEAEAKAATADEDDGMPSMKKKIVKVQRAAPAAKAERRTEASFVPALAAAEKSEAKAAALQAAVAEGKAAAEKAKVEEALAKPSELVKKQERVKTGGKSVDQPQEPKVPVDRGAMKELTSTKWNPVSAHAPILVPPSNTPPLAAGTPNAPQTPVAAGATNTGSNVALPKGVDVLKPLGIVRTTSALIAKYDSEELPKVDDELVVNLIQQYSPKKVSRSAAPTWKKAGEDVSLAKEEVQEPASKSGSVQSIDDLIQTLLNLSKPDLSAKAKTTYSGIEDSYIVMAEAKEEAVAEGKAAQEDGMQTLKKEKVKFQRAAPAAKAEGCTDATFVPAVPVHRMHGKSDGVAEAQPSNEWRVADTERKSTSSNRSSKSETPYAAAKQLAEATRQIEGLRNIFRKMTQHDLHRAFRHLRLTLDASRQNRFKLRKIVMKMKNLKLKAAFQGFVEVVIDIQAKKERAMLAMLSWRYPGLQAAFDCWICYVDDRNHFHREAGIQIAKEQLGNLCNLGEAAGREAVEIVMKATDGIQTLFKGWGLGG